MTFLAYQIAYLFNITRYYSPLLHLIGQEMNHVTLSDTVSFHLIFFCFLFFVFNF